MNRKSQKKIVFLSSSKAFSTTKVRRWSKRVSLQPGSGPCSSASICSKTANRRPSSDLSLHGKRSNLHGKHNILHSMTAFISINVSLQWFKFRNESRKTGASDLIAHSDSSLQERAAIIFFFPRGQPCLCCWLVSPPRWREASLPVAVPVRSRLGLFLRLRSGRHVLW